MEIFTSFEVNWDFSKVCKNGNFQKLRKEGAFH